MKFLIQKINKEIRHDFSFTLIETIRFRNWLYENRGGNKIMVKFLNTIDVIEPDDIYPPFEFKDNHKDYVPIGTVEFVTEFLQHFYELTPRPLNIPGELSDYNFTRRGVWICGMGGMSCLKNGKYFIKSATTIKKYSGIVTKTDEYFAPNIPIDDYQVSEPISIESEWRAFVYEGKLVGLQNYAGEFTLFPNVNTIKDMIKTYKSAPIAYTLDIGINKNAQSTFVIECHDFFSCGLYGFNQPVLVNMFYRWFKEYLKLNSK